MAEAAANYTILTVGDGLVGQMYAIFVIVVAAAEAVVGLAIVMVLYRQYRGIETDNVNIMKW